MTIETRTTQTSPFARILRLLSPAYMGFKEDLSHFGKKRPQVVIESNSVTTSSCLWMCPKSEVDVQNPVLVFPQVEQCLLLAGQVKDQLFFGHFSPNGGLGDEVPKQIVSDVSLPAGQDAPQKKEVSIFYVKDRKDKPGDPPPEKVRFFKDVFDKAGFEVTVTPLKHSFFGKTLEYKLRKKTMTPVHHFRSQKEQPSLGTFCTDSMLTAGGG